MYFLTGSDVYLYISAKARSVTITAACEKSLGKKVLVCDDFSDNEHARSPETLPALHTNELGHRSFTFSKEQIIEIPALRAHKHKCEDDKQNRLKLKYLVTAGFAVTILGTEWIYCGCFLF